MTTDSKPRSIDGPDVAVIVGHPLPLDIDAVEALAVDTLSRIGAPDRLELSIHFVDGDEIAELNEQALGRSGPTDVVSLPLEDLDEAAWPERGPSDPPLALGDVFISPEVVAERALDNGFDPVAEQALMVVHGVLHLAGFDHDTDVAADRMEAIESAVLGQHGYGRR